MNENLAPIVIFAYTRPLHLKRLLDSVSKNAEAIDSILYVFCDGAKEDASEETLLKIEETRFIAKSENRFKQVIVKEQPKNKGLANSIIDGVTEIINKHETIIVLEDDLLVSPYFLYFMNDSLNRYKNNNKVGQIGACNTFACGEKYPTNQFITMPECLGWATWKNRWDYFDSNPYRLLQQLKDKQLLYKFNAYGSYDMEGLLNDQINGKGTSWAVRWTAVCVLNDWLILYPNPALTNHIESIEATHASINITPPLYTTKPILTTVDVVEIPEVIEAMKKSYAGTGDYFGNLKRENKLAFLKKIIFNIIKR